MDQSNAYNFLYGLTCEWLLPIKKVAFFLRRRKYSKVRVCSLSLVFS